MGKLFGSKPKVPPLAVTTLGGSQQQAITDNKAAEAGAAAQAGFTKDQILSMMEQVIPGFSGMRTTAAGNLASELKGEIPTDVSQAVQNSAAGRSLRSGTAGSGFSRDLVARDLGLTSLDLTSKGLKDTESWMSASEQLLAPAMHEFTSMFVTPGQEYSTTNEQNLQQFQRQWMSNQIGAMPDPVVRGFQDMFMQLSGRGGTGGPRGEWFSNLGSPGAGGGDNMVDDTGSDWQWGSGGNDTNININTNDGGAGLMNEGDWSALGGVP